VSPSLRLLYAEDNTQDAELTRARFADGAPDIALEVVQTGATCLARLADAPYDALLLDHHLPDMEGLDVLKALARAKTQLPVVLVTGVGDEDLVVKALHLGAASYVPKQGNYLDDLPELVRHVVEDHRSRRSQGLLADATRRILYVEHNAMDVELTVRHFAETTPLGELDVVGTCAEALERLASASTYDVALIDLRMPDQSGLDFAREAQRRRLPLPPFIVLSGRGDEAAAIASLKLGAADYVTKREGYLEQLQHAVEHAVAHHRLAQVSEKLRAELAERQRVADALWASEQRFRDTFERSTIGKSITSRDGRLFKVNQAFADMLGFTIEELQGRGLTEITHPDDLAPTLEALARLFAGEQTRHRMEKRYRHRDGHVVYADVSTTRLRDAQAEPPLLLTSIVDISERKGFEAEREKLESQLRLSQRMEAIGRLAGGVAHDFNNLLSVILCGTDFALARARHDQGLTEELLQVRTAGERAAALTRQLLAFGRKQMLDPVVLSLNHVAADIEKMLRRILGEDIEYVHALAADLGLVWADRGQVEQVMMNLVVNARDAMPEGGKLTLATANVVLDATFAAKHLAVQPGPYVELAIADTGSGMDAETQARIFEPFFTTKATGHGTGLGLSTVYGIVKQSGGSIWVYSEVGHGTTFKIYLPRVQSAATSPSAPSGTPGRTSGTETVLVVEDEAAIREIAKRILAAAGYQVLAARNGNDALALAETHSAPIHLVLTDVVMPELGGVALVERLHATRPELKVLYMSGYSDEAVAQRGKPGAPIHFVAKPFSADTLTRKVREVLDSA
jgi:two-component system cell cycle sensor histidine kinase/response regulator CckA